MCVKSKSQFLVLLNYQLALCDYQTNLRFFGKSAVFRAHALKIIFRLVYVIFHFFSNSSSDMASEQNHCLLEHSCYYRFYIECPQMPNGRHVRECYSKYYDDADSFHCLNRMNMKDLFSTKLNEKKKSNSKISVNLNTELKFDENGFSIFSISGRSLFGEEKVKWKNVYRDLKKNGITNYWKLSRESQLIHTNTLYNLILGDLGFKGRHFLEKNGLLE